MEQKNVSVDWKTRAAKLFCLGFSLFLGWLVLRYAKGLLAVALIVWGVSAAIDALARRTAKKIRLPQKLLAAVYFILLIFLLGFAVFLILNRLVKELEGLALWMEENRVMIEQRIDGVSASVEKFFSRFPIGSAAEEGASPGKSVDSMLSEMIQSMLGALGGVLRATPKALITVVVTLMACFYLSMDYEGFRDRLIFLFPSNMGPRIDVFRQKAGSAVRRYLRAYLLLLLLTFTEVFLGLLILGKSYAFLIALLIALVDILPIVGAGTVLVPWAIVMLLLKNYYLGFGLLILWGVVTIVRQIAEPHLVGGSLGIHPLVSLAFMFAGLELFGFFGMILGPAAALVLKEFLTAEKAEESEGAL